MPSHSDAPRSAADHLDPAVVHERIVRRPARRLLVTTLVTGVISAVASAGVLALQSGPAYVRAVLESRTLGAAEVTEAQVAGFLTPAWGVPAAVAGILALTLLGAWAIARLARPVRWLGTAVVGVGLLTAVFWMVDGGRMVAAGGAGPLVLAAVVAMAVSCAAWLLLTHLRSTRDAFDG